MKRADMIILPKPSRPERLVREIVVEGKVIKFRSREDFIRFLTEKIPPYRGGRSGGRIPKHVR